MKRQSSLKAQSIEERFNKAKRIKNFFLFSTIVLLIMPFFGYVVDKVISEGFSMPSAEEWQYFPLNWGTYGLMGFVGIFLIALVISTIIVLFRSISTTGFTLFGFILSLGGTILFYGLIVSAFVGLASWTSKKFSTDFEFTLLGIYVNGNKSIPGISETLGVALLMSLFYDSILIICLIATIISWKHYHILKIPAEEAQAARKLAEQQAAEERALQKRLNKERKAQEEKERKEFERRLLELARDSRRDSSLGEYSFFEGCTSLAQADERYHKLIQVYEASDGSGDPALVSVIAKQYELLKNRLEANAERDHSPNI